MDTIHLIQNRREFLSALGLFLVGRASGGDASASVIEIASDGFASTPTMQRRPSPTRVRLPALVPVIAVNRGISIEPGRWKIIVGHHSGVAVGNAAIYDRAHRLRGMENGLAYHFVIGNGSKSGDGEIEIGGRWLHQLQGGHVRDDAVNQIGVGICCVGNFQETKPTRAQLRSFIALVEYLERDVVKTPVRFAVHREIDPGHTVCPGKRFPIAAMQARFG